MLDRTDTLFSHVKPEDTAFVSGGLGLSTYPDKCRVQFERRTLPG